MTDPSPPGVGPSIHVVVARGASPTITHRRPKAIRALIGRPVDRAIATVSLLLPICGEAQRLAAVRAVEAAQESPAPLAIERWRDFGLFAEQAAAIAWRLAVDWPVLIGAPADLGAVKTVRQAVKPIADAAHRAEAAYADDEAPPNGASEPALRDAVEAGAEALERLAGPAGVDDLDAMLARLADCDSAAAAVLKRAAAAPTGLGAHCGRRLDPTSFAEIAAPLASDPLGDDAVPEANALEVGPFARAGDPVVDAAERRFGAGVFARLLAGARAARRWGEAARSALDGDGERHAWSLASTAHAGVGAATTARGPVLHRIALEGSKDAPIIADWRVVAPTDWHFAPNGPVFRTFQSYAPLDLKQSDAALCIAGFDACTPCTVETVGYA